MNTIEEEFRQEQNQVFAFINKLSPFGVKPGENDSREELDEARRTNRVVLDLLSHVGAKIPEDLLYFVSRTNTGRNEGPLPIEEQKKYLPLG